MTDIVSIEAARAVGAISKGALCRTAGVDRTTYSRLLKRPGSGRVETLNRLSAAIAELRREVRHG